MHTDEILKMTNSNVYDKQVSKHYTYRYLITKTNNVIRLATTKIYDEKKYAIYLVAGADDNVKLPEEVTIEAGFLVLKTDKNQIFIPEETIIEILKLNN